DRNVTGVQTCALPIFGFALRVDGRPAEEIRERVETVMGKIGMAEVLDSVPGDLTRLQRQTVALARAVVRKPKVLIMDEPVVNLRSEERRVGTESTGGA